jgi:hypothetical protein
MSFTKSAVLVPPLSDPAASQVRHSTILLVQWALALACTYMVLFSEQSRGIAGWGSFVVLAFLLMNFAIGRVDAMTAQGRTFMVVVGLLDAVLIVASLQASGQLSVELILLCLGIVILAVAGLRLPTIAIGSLGMMSAYMLIVVWTGDESPWHTGTLLRLPFLFTAAVVYAWFVELGSSTSAAAGAADVKEELASQLRAIERCRLALGSEQPSAAESALAEIEQTTRSLERKLAQA